MEKNEYNDIPVHYCKSCLSLKIINDTGFEGLDYCESCGSTNIDLIHINEWEKLFRNRYGFDHLTGVPNYLRK